ncbi:MAG TPA: polysaccharide biosynthesis C-terminal domain-containing protein [Thermoanaerobaculia bacterium]|nr:polysaccharide biosynthesis C-terminal domain-containing protein [Thermoanaerobaculia bacterium]
MKPPEEEAGPADIAAVVPAEGDGTFPAGVPPAAPAPIPSEVPREIVSAPVLRTILTIGIIQAGTMAFYLVRSKITAVTVGPVGVGTISVVDQVVALVTQVSTFSLPYAAVKFLSAAHSESHEAFARQYAAFLRALLLVSIAGSGLAIAVVSFWPQVLGPKVSGSQALVRLALLAIPATNLAGLLTNAIAAARRTHASALMGLWTAAALAVCCGAGILAARLPGFYIGTVTAWVLVAAGGLIYLSRTEKLSLAGPRVRLIEELKAHKAILRFAAAIYAVSFTTPLGYLVSRYAVVQAGDFHAAGILQAALGPALALVTLMRSSNSLFLTPLMNRRIDEREKFHGAIDFLRAFSLATGVVALPILLFPHLLIGILYSSKFFEAAAVAYLFVIAETVQLLAGVNQALLIGLDQIGTHVVISMIGDAFIALASLALVPRIGLHGVALAFLGNGLLVFALTSWRIWKTHGMAIPVAAGWLPVLTLAAMSVLGEVANDFPSNAPIVLGVKAAVGASIGLLVVTSKPVRTVFRFRSG